MGAPVVIVDYDPRWPAVYEEEKSRIVQAIGSHIITIEHVGSTAVPGLAAKPIIDIMVALQHLEDAKVCRGPLGRMGYKYVPEYEKQIPERRYFRKGPPEGRTHHLHMVERTSDFWRIHLLFRDHLRSHGDVATEYERVKRDLAERYRTDRSGYSEAKTEFIQRVAAQASEERGITGARP